MSADELDLAAIRERAEQATPGLVQRVEDAEAEVASLLTEVSVLRAGGVEVTLADYDQMRHARDAARARLAAVVALAEEWERRGEYGDASLTEGARAIRAALGSEPAEVVADQHVHESRYGPGDVTFGGLSYYCGTFREPLVPPTSVAEVVAVCSICGSDDPSDCERHGLCCDDCHDALPAEVVAGIKAEAEGVRGVIRAAVVGHLPQSVGHGHWPRCFSHPAPVDYTPDHVTDVVMSALSPFLRAEVVAGDVDPLCRERNPGLDEWHGNCCRFPKSCSPYIRAEVVAGGDGDE